LLLYLPKSVETFFGSDGPVMNSLSFQSKSNLA
jgi:hypothetical protein